MRRWTRLLVGILATVISAAAFYLSTGLGTLWPLAWVAPLPVLVISSERSGPVAALIAFIAFFLGSLNTPYGLGGWIVFGLPVNRLCGRRVGLPRRGAANGGLAGNFRLSGSVDDLRIPVCPDFPERNVVEPRLLTD